MSVLRLVPQSVRLPQFSLHMCEPAAYFKFACCVCRLVDDGGDSLSLAGDASNGKCVMYARMATLEQVCCALPI